MMEPTQTKYPWRTVVRSAFQLIVGLAALIVVLVPVGAGTPAAVATLVAVSLTVTRVMANPAVNAWLASSPLTSWLAAAPQ